MRIDIQITAHLCQQVAAISFFRSLRVVNSSPKYKRPWLPFSLSATNWQATFGAAPASVFGPRIPRFSLSHSRTDVSAGQAETRGHREATDLARSPGGAMQAGRRHFSGGCLNGAIGASAALPTSLLGNSGEIRFREMGVIPPCGIHSDYVDL
jgi:hypothetical protein